VRYQNFALHYITTLLLQYCVLSVSILFHSILGYINSLLTLTLTFQTFVPKYYYTHHVKKRVVPIVPATSISCVHHCLAAAAT